MAWFAGISILIILIILIIVFSKIHIQIKKIYISNNNYQNKLEYDYEIYLQIYVFNKIKIVSIKIDKAKIQKLNIKQKIDFSNMKKDLPSKKELKYIIKKLDIEFSNLYLNLEIGTEDVIITSAIIAIISALIGIGLAQVIKNYEEEKYKYKIVPIYQNKNKINLNLDCIIQVKMVHIICIIYVLLKRRRVDKHERTSNRGTYDYGYE